MRRWAIPVLQALWTVFIVCAVVLLERSWRAECAIWDDSCQDTAGAGFVWLVCAGAIAWVSGMVFLVLLGRWGDPSTDRSVQ
jgi:hypothetical protein